MEATSHPAAVISVNDLAKSYGKFAALAQVSFDIPANQVCALLGPNGAGKSTTMKLLTGLISPTSGQIRMAGIDMLRNRIEGSRQIGYLPENGPLYPEMTPCSSLRYHGKVRGLNRSELSNRLEFVCQQCDLQDVWHKPIAKLSRGYKQRVGMAQAILHDPQILILDEPTSGLDPNQLVGIRKLIQELGESKTVLLSTHILQEVEMVCSHVLLINNGRLKFDGTLSSLSNQGPIEKEFHRLTEMSA